MVRLNDDIVVGRDDVVQRFILLANSHDGSGAVTIRFTPIRVVCQNTLNYAMKRSTGVVSVAHTRNVHANLAEKQAETIQRVVSQVFKDAERVFGLMAAFKMSGPQTEQFLETLFPKSKLQKEKGQEPERWQRIRTVLEDTKVTPPATKNTLWGLYNAVARDEDHRTSRESDPSRRLERVWFGSGHDLKRTALDAARRFMRPAA
jgi:phage/plasmid-like protein (TIGR03299 family)